MRPLRETPAYSPETLKTSAMKILSNPIVLVLLGLLLGIGTSTAVIWKTAHPLVREIAHAREKGQTPEKPEQPWDFWTLEIEALASELKDQKALLKQREDNVGLRETRVVAEQQELAKTRKQIESIRDEIATKMIEVQADEAKNLKTLANTYKNLSPKSAVPILQEMEELTVVKVLSLMKTDEVSALFEEMGKSPDPTVVKRAALLSERMRLLKATRSNTSASAAQP